MPPKGSTPPCARPLAMNAGREEDEAGRGDDGRRSRAAGARRAAARSRPRRRAGTRSCATCTRMRSDRLVRYWREEVAAVVAECGRGVGVALMYAADDVGDRSEKELRHQRPVTAPAAIAAPRRRRTAGCNPVQKNAIAASGTMAIADGHLATSWNQMISPSGEPGRAFGPTGESAVGEQEEETRGGHDDEDREVVVSGCLGLDPRDSVGPGADGRDHGDAVRSV